MTDAQQQQVEATADWIGKLRTEIGRVIVGQTALVDRLLVGLLANGHVLLEGVPGLAKTMSVRTLADSVQASFHRIQFTPDLLPADILGSSIYHPVEGSFAFRPGPIFCNVLLADEINRTPPKTQAALLEATGREVLADQVEDELPPLMKCCRAKALDAFAFEGTSFFR